MSEEGLDLLLKIAHSSNKIKGYADGLCGAVRNADYPQADKYMALIDKEGDVYDKLFHEFGKSLSPEIAK